MQNAEVKKFNTIELKNNFISNQYKFYKLFIARMKNYKEFFILK